MFMHINDVLHAMVR